MLAIDINRGPAWPLHKTEAEITNDKKNTQIYGVLGSYLSFVYVIHHVGSTVEWTSCGIPRLSILV